MSFPSHDVDAGDDDDNSWVKAILIINFNHTRGQEVNYSYPSSSLSASTLSDIAMLSMPDNLDANDTNKHNIQYTFRVREKSNEDNNCIDIFHYCYVNFLQIKMKSEKRGYFQQSVLIVTSQPYNVYSDIVIRLTTVLNDIPQFQTLLNNTTMTSLSAINDDTILDTTLQVAFQHFKSWPIPIPGKEVKLPFFGEIFQLLVPFHPIYASIHNKDNRSFNHILREKGLESGTGLYETNLVHALDNLGLLPHLWSLWELIVTGNNVLVFSSSAKICSTVVGALLSMLAPLPYAGDHRPYISPYDSDIKLLVQACNTSSSSSGSSSSSSSSSSSRDSRDSNELGNDGETALLRDNHIVTSPASVYMYNVRSKMQKKQPNIVLGVTNPFLLREFANIDAVLLLPNPTSIKSKSSSTLFGLLSSSLSTATTTTTYDTNVHIVSNNETLETIHDDWVHANKSKIGGLLCLRNRSSLLPDKDIQRRLMTLSATVDAGTTTTLAGKSEKIIVGGMLLREHFRRLTTTLLKPFESLFSNSDDPFSSFITTKTISSLFLSNSTSTILNSTSMNDIISNLSSNSNLMLTMPSILQRSEWKSIIIKFSQSRTFLAWKTSRQDLLVIKIWLETCWFCKNMTNKQFFKLFDIITVSSNDINYDIYEKVLKKLVCVIDFLTNIRSAGKWLIQENDADVLIKAMKSHLDYLIMKVSEYKN